MGAATSIPRQINQDQTNPVPARRVVYRKQGSGIGRKPWDANPMKDAVAKAAKAKEQVTAEKKPATKDNLPKEEAVPENSNNQENRPIMNKEFRNNDRDVSRKILLISRVRREGFEAVIKKSLTTDKEFITTLNGKTDAELRQLSSSLENNLQLI